MFLLGTPRRPELMEPLALCKPLRQSSHGVAHGTRTASPRSELGMLPSQGGEAPPFPVARPEVVGLACSLESFTRLKYRKQLKTSENAPLRRN